MVTCVSLLHTSLQQRERRWRDDPQGGAAWGWRQRRGRGPAC